MTDTNFDKCPFCGSSNAYINLATWRVTCTACGSSGPVAVDGTLFGAAAAWNKRAEPIMWVSNYSMPGTPSLDELEAENKRLNDKTTSLLDILRIRKNHLEELEAENKRLSQELTNTQSIARRNKLFAINRGDALDEVSKENDNLREAIRKARKVLTILDKNFHQDEATEARRILKSALTGEG
jgi:hypothetical protein